MDQSSNDSNVTKSRNLASLLSMFLSGNALSPFIDNLKFDDRCINMKHPVSKPSASIMYNILSNQHIGIDKTFDVYATYLHLMYKMCTCSGIPYDEGFFILCFLYRLDCNFDKTREHFNTRMLNWYKSSLNVLQI